MRNLTLAVFTVLLFVTGASAQEWKTDFEKAKEEAANKHMPIVLVFQGSDWCAPCIKLDREIWTTEEFKSYAKDHFVMLKADFPRKKKNALPEKQQEQNKILAENYNKNGFFPFVVIMDDTGKVLGETGYKKLPVSQYIEMLESFTK